MLHLNMPFSLPVIVDRCFADPYREDQTNDVWIGSDIDPIPLGRRRAWNGQIVEFWLIVQDDTPIIIAYRSGMPIGLRDGDSYPVGYIAIALPVFVA